MKQNPSNKWIQQCRRMQDEYTKINCISIHLKWTIQSEINKTNPFAIELKWIRYLWINLTKQVQELCTENYKFAVRERILCSASWKGLGGLNLTSLDFAQFVYLLWLLVCNFYWKEIKPWVFPAAESVGPSWESLDLWVGMGTPVTGNCRQIDS